MASTSAQYGFGSGILYGIRNDVVNATPVRFGVLQDVSIDFSAEAKELYGQLQFAVDVARGKTKITGKAKFAILQASVYNNLYFGQTTTPLTQTLFAYNEAATVGSVVTGTTNGVTATSSPTLHFASTPAGVVVGASIADATAPTAITAGTYVLSKTGTTVTMSANAAGPGVGATDVINFGPSATASNAATFATDLGVYYAATGLPLTLVAGGPAAGQYTVTSAGVYSFNSADAGVAVLLNYNYTATTGSTIAVNNLIMGTTPKFMAVFNQTYEGHTLELTLYSCVSSKLTLPTKLDDYVINEMDFMAYANAAGQVASLSLDN